MADVVNQPQATQPDPRKRRGGRARVWALVGAVGVFPLVAALLLGTVGGIGVFTFGYGKGFSYMKNDPAACANCHVMQEHFQSWNRSSHHAVATCNDCHLPHHPVMKWVVKGDNGFFHSLAFTTGQYHDPIQIKPRNRRVTQDACLSCHSTTVHEMLTVERKGTISEAATAGGGGELWCVQCHADVGHAGRRRGSFGLVAQDPPTSEDSYDGMELPAIKPENRVGAAAGGEGRR